ncbi:MULTISPECIES: sugar transferase [Lentilactobacillus]|uniref:Priming glycosyltransferase, polyprenyl glycosylphosphotransferase n=2 Tax=Lentilactobacillus TaxID=2767893 RepID=A0A0R1KTM0_9LACO|nr:MULTISPECIES: sugar transferase [Lentilactobacillus]KRK86645.1 priming glycosyltransferase, polyprenyl glycosylphosphotransferase [Lentilactobacillus sunkii DSM 19904]MCT3545311.1 sugar transferase [Lentilactobacillus buchneri]RRF98340.1 MAG: sugar transferase [Coriobacteriaceae bacterium]GEP25069.1 capsular polysaccharide biosynthesis protein [Lentilactobacillus diolivorans]
MQSTHDKNNIYFKDFYKENIGPKVDSLYLPIKRILDILFSLMLIILTFPIVMVTVVAVKCESHGPIFYKQVRVGLMGRKIVITKFRSMYMDAEKNGAQWAQKNDPRVTRVGKIIRRTRIDELPQLFSVLKGDLSLIGPRPERPNFTEEFSHKYPGFEKRLRIKPGLSGYAQINGGYDIDPGQKAKLDCYYINHLSFWIDVKIFISTIKIIFSGEGAR